MKSYRVEIAAPARAQVLAGARWWKENREQNPDLFREEFEPAITLLRRFPWAGPAHPSPFHTDVRRMRLRKTKHHVYYVVDEGRRLVTIVAVWHTARGSDPPL